jgi:D-alanine-D-alanine ligase
MSEFVAVVHGRPSERADDADTLGTAVLIARALERLGFRTHTLSLDLDLGVIEALAAERPLAVFNMVESIRGDGRLAMAALNAMDHFGLRYTGASAEAYAVTTSKLLTKSLLRAAGLPTPDAWLGEVPAERRVIVKSVHEDASIGIDQGSVVGGSAAVREIRRRERRFGGRFFAEEYVPGREFNVSLLELAGEPVVLPLAEMRFDELPSHLLPIVDYAAKWDPQHTHGEAFRRAFGVEQAEPALAAALRDLAVECWHTLALSGYARVDFRVDSAGRPLILEVNANPCLAPDAGYRAALERSGRRFDEAVSAILLAATRDRAG